MKKLKHFNKALNYKILSALPVMSICLITDKQISNAMFKSTLKTFPNTSQPSVTNSPNTKITYLYRNGRRLAIVSSSSSNLTSGTSSTKTSLPQQMPSSTNTSKNTASSISDTKTSSVTATSHKSTTPKLDDRTKVSSTTTTQPSLNLEDENYSFSTVFARYVYFDGDDSDTSPTPTTPRSSSPELDDTTELSSTAATQPSLSLEDENPPFSTVFARYVYFDDDSNTSPTPTTPRSSSPVLDDTTELSSTTVTPPRSSSPVLDDTPELSSTVVTPPRSSSPKLDDTTEISSTVVTPPRSSSPKLDDTTEVSSTVVTPPRLSSPELDDTLELSSAAVTPPKSSSPVLDDTPELSSTTVTPPRLSSPKLDDTIKFSSTVVTKHKTSNLEKLRTFLKKFFKPQPKIDLSGYKAGITLLSDEGLKKILEKELEIKNDPSQNSNEETKILKNNISSLTSFTFKDVMDDITKGKYSKNNKKSIINKHANDIGNDLSKKTTANLDQIVSDFKSYMKNENDTDKINEQIEKLSTNFGESVGTNASAMLLNKILKTKSSSEPATPPKSPTNELNNKIKIFSAPATPLRFSSSELDDTPENPNKITTLPKTFTSNLDNNTESFIKPITHFLESDEDELILISTSPTSSTISNNETSISLTPSRSYSSKSNHEIEAYFRPISTPKSSTSEHEDSPRTSSAIAQTLSLDDNQPFSALAHSFDFDEDSSSSTAITQTLLNLNKDSASTPPKSPTFELEDSPGTSSTVTYNFFDLDEGTSSTPSKSSTPKLDDSPGDSSTPVTKPKSSQSLGTKIKSFFTKSKKEKPTIDLNNYKEIIKNLTNEKLEKILKQELENSTSESPNTKNIDKEIENLKIKVSSISNFTFKDELENIYTKNNIESNLNKDALDFENFIRNNLSENLTTILADFKTYIKNENNPSKINKQIEKLSTDFGDSMGTRAANELKLKILNFQ